VRRVGTGQAKGGKSFGWRVSEGEKKKKKKKRYNTKKRGGLLRHKGLNAKKKANARPNEG